MMAISKPALGAFARNLVMQAFDALSEKAGTAMGADATTGLQKLADSWRDLTEEERQRLASYVTSAAEMAAAALPVALTAARKRVPKRVKRAAAAVVHDVKAAVDESRAKRKDKKDKKRKKKDKKKAKKKKKK
jgi:hypothetical protein